MIYDAYDRSEFYRDAAMAHAFLAMAYGYLEPPGKQELLEQGELALSYFTQLETVPTGFPLTTLVYSSPLFPYTSISPLCSSPHLPG